MTFNEAYGWLKSNQHDVAVLLKAGDKKALGMYAAYSAWHRTKLDAHLASEFVKHVEDFIRRELMIDERMQLMNKYGYKLQS